jgi:predicted nucleic acid-binding protein
MDEVLIDTNILIYAYQSQEPLKHDRAVEVVEMLVASGRGRLSAQVLAEFANATTRGQRPILSTTEASTYVELLARSFAVFDVTQFAVLEALRGVRQHRMSYFDAQIWATAKLNQVSTVFTEDFDTGRVLEGVRFLNPLQAGFDLASWR